jgi:O-antigen/teichoic acid export membrane protein
LASRFLTGITWNLMAMAFMQGATFAVNIAVANILGRRVFGEYAMVQNTMLTFAGVAQMAVGYTATKYVAEFRSSDPEKAGHILRLCSIVATTSAAVAALTLLAGASWLAAIVLRAPHLTTGFVVAAFVVFFTVMNGYQIGALTGLESYRPLAVAGAVSGVIMVASSTSAAWVAGLNGGLAGLGLGTLCHWVLLRRSLAEQITRQGIPIRYSPRRSETAIFWTFALPATLSGFVSLPSLWLANTFLVRQPNGYEQMGLYAAAVNFRMIVLFLPQVINRVGMSVLNHERGAADQERYRTAFWVNGALTAAVVVVGVFAVVLLGPWLLPLFGRSFGDAYPVLIVLVLSTIPEALAVAAFQVLQSQARMWLSLLAVSIPRDGLIVVMAYTLTPLYGAVGLAWAYTLGWLVALLAIVILVSRVRFDVAPRPRTLPSVT